MQNLTKYTHLLLSKTIWGRQFLKLGKKGESLVYDEGGAGVV